MQQGSTSFPLLCLFDSGSVFESKGKEILTDVSYQADIWLRYTNAHLNHIELIISNLISSWNLDGNVKTRGTECKDPTTS